MKAIAVKGFSRKHTTVVWGATLAFLLTGCTQESGAPEQVPAAKERAQPEVASVATEPDMLSLDDIFELDHHAGIDASFELISSATDPRVRFDTAVRLISNMLRYNIDNAQVRSEAVGILIMEAIAVRQTGSGGFRYPGGRLLYNFDIFSAPLSADHLDALNELYSLPSQQLWGTDIAMLGVHEVGDYMSLADAILGDVNIDEKLLSYDNGEIPQPSLISWFNTAQLPALVIKVRHGDPQSIEHVLAYYNRLHHFHRTRLISHLELAANQPEIQTYIVSELFSDEHMISGTHTDYIAPIAWYAGRSLMRTYLDYPYPDFLQQEGPPEATMNEEVIYMRQFARDNVAGEILAAAEVE